MSWSLKSVPQTITIALLLFISTLSSSAWVPVTRCFPPQADVNPVLLLSLCSWSPLSSAGTGCVFHAPGVRREHQTGLWKGSSPMLSPTCFGCNKGDFSFVSHLSSTKNAMGLELIKMYLLPIELYSLGVFCFVFFFSEDIILKRMQSTFFKVKTASLNLNLSLNPFEWEASQHPSNLVEGEQSTLASWTLSTHQDTTRV